MQQSNQNMDQGNNQENNQLNSVTITENSVENTDQNNNNNNNIPKSLSPVMMITPSGVLESAQMQPLQQSSLLMQNQYPQYDWDIKWLKGDEYANMLEKIDEYCQLYKLQKYSKKTHPEDIYRAPQNGLIYFVEGSCVGSEFGFPRVPFRKQYRWKKMNFTTDLPKKRPQVTYIVASSVKCQKQTGNDRNKPDNSKKEQDIYRMHAVILYKKSENNQNQQSSANSSENQTEGQNINNPSQVVPPGTKQYILCHIRKMDINEDEKIPSKQPSTNNNSSASASSQDIQEVVAYQQKRKSTQSKKIDGIRKKSQKEKSEGIDNDEDDSDDFQSEELENDDINEDENRSNQIQNKRKNSSINETKSNNDSQGIQYQGYPCKDSNKQSKSVSKHLSKQQNKQSDIFQQQQSFDMILKQPVVTDTSPEQPTDFLLMNNANRNYQQSSNHQQNNQQRDQQRQSATIENINKKPKSESVNNNNYSSNQQNSFNQNSQLRKTYVSSFKSSVPQNNSNPQQYSNMNQQSLVQSPNNNLMKRSPGNCEINSITSSSNTNQNKEEELNSTLPATTSTTPNVLSNQNMPTQTTNQYPATQFGNAMYMNNSGLSYQPTGGNGGMMMMQPFNNLQGMPSSTMNYSQFPNMFMFVNQIHQQYTPDQVSGMQQQQAQQNQQLQNTLAYQSLMPYNSNIYNLIRPQQVNMELLTLLLSNQQNLHNEIDYINLYSQQMNNIPMNNNAYLPNQGNSNSQ